jgi:hypothetical protein
VANASPEENPSDHRRRPCPCMSVPKTSGNVPHASPRSTNVQLLVRKVRSAGNILADRVVVLFLFSFLLGREALRTSPPPPLLLMSLSLSKLSHPTVFAHTTRRFLSWGGLPHCMALQYIIRASSVWALVDFKHGCCHSHTLRVKDGLIWTCTYLSVIHSCLGFYGNSKHYTANRIQSSLLSILPSLPRAWSHVVFVLLYQRHR